MAGTEEPQAEPIEEEDQIAEPEEPQDEPVEEDTQITELENPQDEPTEEEAQIIEPENPQVTTSDEEALALLGQAAHHRVRQLLGTGRRQNLLIFGVDAVETAYRDGKVGYLLVALDAQSAAKSSCVTDAVSKGNAAAWGTRATLGQLLGRPEVGILAVRDRGLARSLFGAIAMALLAGKRPVEASEQVVSKFFE
jgi:hypothetical protein